MMSTVQCQNRSFSFNLQCIDAYSSSYCFHCEISARLSPNNSYLPRFSLETFSSCENDTWTCKSIWPLPGISSCLIHTKDSNHLIEKIKSFLYLLSNLDWLLLFWFDFFFYLMQLFNETGKKKKKECRSSSSWSSFRIDPRRISATLVCWGTRWRWESQTTFDT